jgi:hypothetical protein
MDIKGIKGLLLADIEKEVAKGAKFVYFTYCISIVVTTFRRNSDIYFVRSDENQLKYGWKYMLISFLLGWWGFPWGIVYTFKSLFDGDENVTCDVMKIFRQRNPKPQNQQSQITNWDTFNQNNNNI